MTASVKPLNPKLTNRRLNVVTMATTPKSAGVKSRARTTVLATWIAVLTPVANTEAPAPRTARRRSSLPTTTGRKAPLVSNGVIRFFSPTTIIGRRFFSAVRQPVSTCLAGPQAFQRRHVRSVATAKGSHLQEYTSLNQDRPAHEQLQVGCRASEERYGADSPGKRVGERMG